MLYLLVGVEVGSCSRRSSAAAPFDGGPEHLPGLATLHALLQKRRVRPTYLVAHAVAKNQQAASMLREMREGRDCEIGAEHEAWATPPCSDQDATRRPYALQLRPDQFAAQVASLTDAIAEAVGERPLSYRSGRFGFSASHVFELERAGYRVESSVVPLLHERHVGGPDFAGAPPTPYFLAYDDPTASGTSNLLEIPVSAALNRRTPAVIERIYGRSPSGGAARKLLERVGAARVQWLRPSCSTLDGMCTLARRMKHDGVPLVNLLLDWSEAAFDALGAGKTTQELDRLLGRLEDALAYIGNDLGAIPVTFSEFRSLYCGGQEAPPS